MQETWVRSLAWEYPLEKGKSTHSSILTWTIPGTVQSMGFQRVRHDWVTFTFTFSMCICVWNILLRLIYKIFSFSPEVFITIPTKTLAFSSDSYISFLHSLTEIKNISIYLASKVWPKIWRQLTIDVASFPKEETNSCINCSEKFSMFLFLLTLVFQKISQGTTQSG